jgi:hypothetical protein
LARLHTCRLTEATFLPVVSKHLLICVNVTALRTHHLIGATANQGLGRSPDQLIS